MYSFSCVLWAIFSASVLCQIAAIFLIMEAETPQKLIPNHRTINSKTVSENSTNIIRCKSVNQKNK